MSKLVRNLLVVAITLGLWGISFLFVGDSKKPDDPTEAPCRAQIDSIQRSKIKWAAATHQPPTAEPTAEQLLPYLPNHKMPICPGYGKYTINTVTNSPHCSIENHVYP
jgi:hypothetical protein